MGVPSKLSCPSWAHIQSRSILWEQPNVNRLLLKYAGDLALLTGIKDFPHVNIMMVPRLPVKQISSSKQKFKRVPHLIFDDKQSHHGEPASDPSQYHLVSAQELYYQINRRTRRALQYMRS
ncbi:hypothetical protein M378DRAFT_19028 [Amanita muscaria Koide BX008]|uniref:Uncharacterized protein n=1 Tax=Amanita muscaria (strain Koide BX008) TaxID=946122 RepID=A0A0C2RVQ1_AMAMK|nr:hypothetical protein M378DRAFT_19028 [Amanita muscaria Koide BX008]